MPEPSSPRSLILLIGLLPLGILLVLVPYSKTLEASQMGMTRATDALHATGTLHTPRAAHTATRLPDGEILITGGFAGEEAQPFRDAERYDPVLGAFTSAGSMTTGRQSHTATLLGDGRVLIAGGYAGSYLASAEVYDPGTGTFTLTGPMTTGRIAHRATRLADGRVLITGGAGAGGTTLSSAEIYDPATGTFSTVGDLVTGRGGHTQTLSVDGSVLITGGSGKRGSAQVLAGAERFDPVTGLFHAVGDMTIPRRKHAAVLLVDGRVLILGGSDAQDWRGRYTSAELFDPVTETFSMTGSLHEARFKHRAAVTRLADGTVLVAGGAETLERYDPTSEQFTPVADRFDTGRFFATATLLSDGRVLISGGYDGRIRSTEKAWLYQP